MKTNISILNITLLGLLALAIFPAVAAAQEKTLPGHVPAAISARHLQSTGQLAPNSSLNLAISLPVRNEQALNDLLVQMYNPSSTNYHRFLKPGEFSQRFGATAQDYQSVIDFAKANGLIVVSTNSNQTLLDVSGKVSDIQKAFKITLRTYNHPTDHRDFYAPDTDPTVSSSLPIMHISGLDNYFIPHPAYIRTSLNPASGAKPGTGSGPFGLYMGMDFHNAYAPGVALEGAGQRVALFELDGYFTSDIISYESQAGLPAATITNISVDGGVPTPSFGGDVEVSLDIDMVISMATNLSSVIVYEAPNGPLNSPVDLLNRIASDDLANQISSSWLIGDSPAYDVYYKQMALQGQSFFQCSGDNGAYFTSNEQDQEYADDTNVTIVGGTTLSTASAGGAWSSETVWNQFVEGSGTDGSGGGTNWNGVPIPSWQQPVGMTNNQGSTTLRNVPDVSLTADNIFIIADNGNQFSVGGTSAATPLWAAFTALVNEQATNSNLPPMGFLNPALYALGLGTNYTNCFHDITTGNNTNLTVNNAYFAVPGYDLATGWGTPNGSNLINALTAIAPTITNIYTHLSPPPPPYGQTLPVLNGGNPNGNWELFVQDEQPINGGMISNGWSLTVTTANPLGFYADDYVAMAASATNILTNTDVTFTIGVTNYGPSTSSNVVVSDELPLGFTFISSSSSVGSVSLDGQSLTWSVSNLLDTVGAQLTLKLQANEAGTAINSATVQATTPDPNPADASAEVVVNVYSSPSAPLLGVGTMGAGRQFHLTVSNSQFPVVIQASTNLVHWVNVYTNLPPFIFTDTMSPGYPTRFYRAQAQ